jgi:hypothetical protein
MDLTVTIATVGGAGRAAPARSARCRLLQPRHLRGPDFLRFGLLRQAQQSETQQQAQAATVRPAPESQTRCVDFGERLSESPLSLVWTLVRKAVDPSEGQNAQNQRVARVIPWT